eukprot:TRINITY_DN11438_c0_g3_i2.p1 TRINITY_DN11438_c0_g3~~TRINITY_DN11438_c0_g3_i2.p1  ORF type:complete len:415 (+),score=72.67 TRINITY_DN11438_c0_g3_i2:61-1245(+)
MSGVAPLPEDVPQFVTTADEKARRRELVSSGGRVVHMLIGDAIGDAFGFGIEMQDAHWIREQVVDFDKWPWSPCMEPHDVYNHVPGMYSDDCEMTVGLMKALLGPKGQNIEAPEMLAAWRAEWDLAKLRPPPAEPGGERTGHGSVKGWFKGEKPIEEVQAFQAAKSEPGNAPPMRSLPLAFVDASERERLCAANADATHPHPRARAASFLVATAGSWLLEGGEQSKVLGVCLAALQASKLAEPDTEEHLSRLEALPDYHDFGERFASMSPDVHELLCGPQPCPMLRGKPAGATGTTPMRGIGSDAMRTAGVVLYLVKHHRGPVDILRASIDIGGDVDSVAALCLGLLGTTSGLRFGEEGGIPWSLVEGLEGVEYLVGRAKEFEAWCGKRRDDRE